MTNGNSINGYAIAVNLRKRKTFLVEGKSDRRLIKRLLANLDAICHKDFVFDTAEIINSDDPMLNNARGNKSKVLVAAQRLADQEKFAALVDREWDGLWDGQSWIQYSDPEQLRNLYVTLGHSIENYGFNPETFHRKIINRCYESVTRDDANAVVSSFPACVKMALAISQEALQTNSLGRMSGIIRYENFCWEDALNVTIVSSDRMRSEFNKRNLGDSEAYCADINSIISNGNLEDTDYLHFYPHGHLGMEVIFSAICARLLSYGASDADVDILATESLENREIALKDHLESLPELPEPFNRIINFFRQT